MAPLVALLFVVKTIIRSVGPSHSAKVQQLPAEWQNNESIFALFSPPPPIKAFPESHASGRVQTRAEFIF